MDSTLIGTITPGQGEPTGNGNERVSPPLSRDPELGSHHKIIIKNVIFFFYYKRL